MRFFPSSLLVGSALLLSGLAGCQSRTPDTAAGQPAAADMPADTTLPASPNDGITAQGIGDYIKVLASDAYQGRRPFTVGEQKTTVFLADEFKKLGLQPGPDGTYFQKVPLVEITGTPAPTMQISGGQQPLTLNYKTDYMAFTEQEKEKVAVKNSALVFAGYGVVAPEYGWNDYAGLDVKGKTVVVLVNDPGNAANDTTFFKGKAMTYYGRWDYKYEEAARHGAAGVLIVHDTKPAAYPWSVVQNSWSGAKLYGQMADKGASKCQVAGWLTLDAAKKLFTAAGQSYDEAYAAANKPGFKAWPLNLQASTSISNTLRRQESKNVVAVLPGTTRPTEYIVYSAHWDHLGVGIPVAGDSIYNGAADNASGCAALLSIAKAFQQAPDKPGRSIVFLAVTGEEQGLLGSMYYASHPLFPVASTVADLNMDDLPNLGPMRDLTVIGYGQSELDDYARAAAQEQGRYIQPDQNADKGYFFRSDHFSFAHVGVPSLYASGSADSWLKGKAYARRMGEEFEAKHYHQPSDEYSPESDFRGMEWDARLLYRVGSRLAAETTFPQWKPGSEFKAIREKSQAAR
ncbi:M28 family metallopeptidase [Hymenobacter elongatus]|uniref:M28 family peptidase n=1 Tax=Hymenobacter elongatus TaxID=877208 RepID=A0A4Z0PH95_9BACT|nr:M28 family metallopeptidase [Hymenobacter elongatus]TGE14462.1 M28 family peptidase [Hymenobacter elongatus]